MLSHMAAVATLHALGDRSRHAIVELLRGGERPVGELVDSLSLSQPAVSKHLRVLKEAGIVEARADAQRRVYRIRPEPFVELDAWMAGYRQLWNVHFDLLEEHLDRERAR
jgi:DNA-binding transcriptional ArsR family regulator